MFKKNIDGNFNENVTSRQPYTIFPKNSRTAMSSSSSSVIRQNNLHHEAIGWGSDTFLVPSDAWTNHPSHLSTSKSSLSRPSMTRVSVGIDPTTTRMSSSMNKRVPWK